MKIFNSYTNQLEEFIPHHPGKVCIYVCGMTVYDYIHIGNARPIVFFDVVHRFLESKGFDVKFVSNFTDVDDKIINKAKKEGRTELEVADQFIRAFLLDIEKLGCRLDYVKPRVTEYMPEIIAFIQTLVDKGFAYVVDGDVFFRVSKIEEYGHLSNRKLEDLIAGARVDINEKKESPLDFVLWKRTTEGINWETPFSVGRPGWHTECVTMIDSIFGEEIDIHGGGADLMFPHHENEIAQSIACHDHRLATYWMHNGWMNINGEKMSKSLGNAIFVKDLPVDAKAFKMFLLSTQYRSPINYTRESLEVYAKEWARLVKTVSTLFHSLDYQHAIRPDLKIEDAEIVLALKSFDEAMGNDFNTANALTAIYAVLKTANNLLRQKKDFDRMNQALSALDRMLGIFGLQIPQTPLTASERGLIDRWEAARVAKDFTLADVLRAELSAKDLY